MFSPGLFSVVLHKMLVFFCSVVENHPPVLIYSSETLLMMPDILFKPVKQRLDHVST